MQSQLNTFDTKGPLDYDNLNIVTHPPPPRRRKSGASLIPFRPYVKCLSSVRQPFSFANGIDKWTVTGKDETFFTQPNARCIGSLINDCDISDVIRWDIEAESTRLPMMCKVWMIVDGAVVERGKPHLVQDAAVQVFTAGRNRRMIIAAQQRYNQTSLTTTTTTTFDRRRRQSWHDLNEYHSIPYFQYTRPNRTAFQEGIQCNMDNEYSTSTQEILPDIAEQVFDENGMNDYIEENVQITVHHLPIPQERVHISITTQTECPFIDGSTSTDSQLIRMFNLNLETNEILLSSIVNPYRPAIPANNSSLVTSNYRHGTEYKTQSVSTGDDYPHWWLRLSTNVILADYITDQREEKEKSLPPPSPRQDQSIQTDAEKSRPSSSSRSRSSGTTINHCGTDYNTFVSSLNHQQQSSTPDSYSHRLRCGCLSNYTTRVRTTSSNTTSAAIIASLLQRYEKTLHERQRAFTIINDQLFDINEVLNHYRDRMQNSSTERSNRAMELYRDTPLLSNEDRSLTTITNLIRDKYRTMPGITCEEMLQGYIPSPRIYPSNSLVISPRERQPLYVHPVQEIRRPDYCDLCLTDHNTSSAWIRYNERRVEELQKRIDLMLQIDDTEEAELLLSSPVYPTTATVTQRIDDVLMTRPRYRYPLLYHSDRLLSPRRYQYRLPYRLNQSVPTTPRQLSRSTTRSTTPVSKSVRISTQSVPPITRRRRQTSSTTQPIVSILRRSSTPYTPRSSRLVESPHIWRSKADGNVYALKQFSIPRYYRLYNDVSFRDMYNFSRILDTYLTPRDYSSLITNYELEQQLLSPIRSAA